MPERTFEIRRATPDDAAGINRVHVAAVGSLAGQSYSAGEVEAWLKDAGPERYQRAITEHGETAFVALSGGAIVGMSAVLGDEVKAVYVHPEVERCGVGSALLAVAENAAEVPPGGRLRLFATLHAVPFYEAKGYRAVERIKHPVGVNNVALDAVRMEKAVT